MKDGVGYSDNPDSADAGNVDVDNLDLGNATAGDQAKLAELEQKCRGYSLLIELSASLRRGEGLGDLFVPTATSINTILKMQRTVVLVQERLKPGFFTVENLQGYSDEEKAALSGKSIELPAELLDPIDAVIVTGADPDDRLREVREFLDLPYFISYPITVRGKAFAVLVTGRLDEEPPDVQQTSKNNAETLQAISTLLASVLAERSLAAAEEQNRIMINAAPICCIVWDEHGDLSDCNPEMLNLFGTTDKEAFLKSFYDYFPERQPDGINSEEMLVRHVRKAFIRGSSLGRWTFKNKNGDLVPTEVTVVRAPKGEDYILVAYMRDLRMHISAQAKLDEAKELAKEYAQIKNEFLASVSHEIRTPMNAISAMGQVIVSCESLNKEQMRIVKQGQRSLMLLTSAIEAILDFSKLDSGQLLLESEEFSIHSMVEEILSLVRADADAKGLKLDAFYDKTVPIRVLGDSLRLQQALLNIINNAIKFTEHGSVKVQVTTEPSAFEYEARVIFKITDTGIGIGKDSISELFKPLYSLDSGYDRKYGGLGMGLPVSQGLVTLMGGKITVESTTGKGSTFSILIPLTLPGKPFVDVKETEESNTSVDPSVLKGLRVLVAEDNEVNQMIIAELLSSIGIKVSIANNGIEAIEQLQERSFDLVLMDIMMPEMDGLTATTKIRADERFAELPVLAMTANSGPEHMAESLKAGMNAHLTKPVDVEELYGALLTWSGRK